ncbi:MAG TPA: DUF1194 domain-containing protein [Xanthobacteraceae bacterium]|nr:DUF1194 domain-containing protein [Xanthobacteraceae bacterium]
MNKAIAPFVASLVALALPSPATAQQRADLQLVLAVDTSGSVDARRFELQKQGYVAAFRNPRVLSAIQSGATQSIAVTMTQWTGPALQMQILPWTLLKDEASVKRFAAAIDDTPRQLFFGGTSISGAIDHARSLLPESPFKAERQVIDVSGDGSNNRGRRVNDARDEAAAAGITINGLPITVLEPDLEKYYRDNVIGGPGAFVIAADTYEMFADAILRKLIAEIASLPQSFAELAKSPGKPQFPGLNIVYLTPLGNVVDAIRWKHIVVHQTEGPAGSARNGAAEQAKNPGKRGVTIWVEPDGTVYWAVPEHIAPLHGDGANRNDNKYVDNSQTYRKVLKDNSIGVEFAGNFPNVAAPPTPAQQQAWAMLVRMLQERYDIPADKVFAHNWIDFKDARYCEGCLLGEQARAQNYAPSRLRARSF